MNFNNTLVLAKKIEAVLWLKTDIFYLRRNSIFISYEIEIEIPLVESLKEEP